MFTKEKGKIAGVFNNPLSVFGVYFDIARTLKFIKNLIHFNLILEWLMNSGNEFFHT